MTITQLSAWILKRVFRRSRRTNTQQSRFAGIDIPSGLGDSAWLLYALVRSTKPEVCVEIGSAQGKSACFIGAALKENGTGKLYAIDPHIGTAWNDENSVDSHGTMLRNLHKAGVAGQVDVIKDFSDKVGVEWNRPIDILFIDGDHSYDGVKRDWDLFSPLVSKFGVVIFHDTIWEVGEVNPKYKRDDMGVPRFVDGLREDGFQVITLSKDYGGSMVQPYRGGIPLR